MVTVRELLERKEFDFSHGEIILHEELRGIISKNGKKVLNSHPFLDEEFNNDFGGIEIPSFIAKDGKFLYVVACYDGATWVEKISLDLNYYLKNYPPCIGGG